MNIMDAKFPYYRNVPDENGKLSVKVEFYSREDYIKCLHTDPLKHLYTFDYEIE